MVDTINVHRKNEADEEAVCDEFNLKKNNYHRKLAPRRSVFDLRTDSMRTDNGKPRQGRLFDTLQGRKNGGLRVDEMIYGMKMAHLSATDDSDDRLEGASPNCMMALEKLVGGDSPEVTARLPLSQILKERFALNLDCWINESGFRKGRPVDTQGFIASNDETIVLSYRFTTSLFDWLANICLTSSEWEVEKDEILGHAGRCSCSRGWWTKIFRSQKSRPRVQTAYYNNFIYTIPMIRKHIIEPLLKNIKSDNKDMKPKKIYVVGCSLGAAISQIAYCFILDELYEYLKDPEYKRVDRLISVTAGCPRIGDRKFRKYITKKMDALRNLDRAVICRLVYNVDIVPHAPPNVLNFCHLNKLVYITKDGKNTIVNPRLSKRFTKFGEIKTIYSTLFQKKKEDRDDTTKAVTVDVRSRLPTLGSNDLGISPLVKAAESVPVAPVEEEEKTAFEKECEGALEPIHDHMPYWYMVFLEKLKDEQDTIYKDDKVETISEA